jgi:hypothetical protein
MSRELEALDGLLGVAGKHARRVLIELKESMGPTWVMVDWENRIEIVATPWADEEEKRVYKVELRRLMRFKGVKVYSFMTEAWIATVGREEWDEVNARPVDGKMVSERGDRQEVVIACACSREQALWKVWRMVREPTTEVIIDLVEKSDLSSVGIKHKSWLDQMLK